MPFPQRVRILFGSLSPSKFGDKISSFADPGCLSRILDPRSEFFPSRIPDPRSKFCPSWIPDHGSEFFPSRMLDPRSASKNLSILAKKNGFSALRNMIRVFPSDLIPDFLPIPDPILDPRSRIQGSKKHRIPDPWSWIWIRSTVDFGFAQAVGGSVSYWLSTGAAVLTTHTMDQLSEAFMCKKEFSVYFIFTLSL